jgi:hypothetical protein
MRQVLTHKEYQKGIKTMSGNPGLVSSENKFKEAIKSEALEVFSEVKPIIKKTYYLFHPDNSINYLRKGKYFVSGKELDIKDGVIKTDDNEVKKALISQGFSLMYEV